MASATFSAEPRSDTGKGVARKLRAAGRIPGVIYGHAREATSLSLVARDFDKLLQHISAGSTVVELTLDGATTKTLIREIQRHPFKKQILHVDFQELVAGEKVNIVAAGVKTSPDHTATVTATIQVSSVAHLAHVMSRIEQVRDVTSVQRDLG